jgi:hypothetical protein
VLVFLDLYVGILDVFLYSSWLLISMKNSILEVVFYAHYEELDCGWKHKVKLCLFSIVLECCDIVIETVLLHMQVIECAYCLLFLGDIGEVGIESFVQIELSLECFRLCVLFSEEVWGRILKLTCLNTGCSRLCH